MSERFSKAAVWALCYYYGYYKTTRFGSTFYSSDVTSVMPTKTVFVLMLFSFSTTIDVRKEVLVWHTNHKQSMFVEFYFNTSVEYNINITYIKLDFFSSSYSKSLDTLALCDTGIKNSDIFGS